MDEIKPVDAEKHQFACRHESKLLTLFRIFRSIRVLMQVPKWTVFVGNGLPLRERFQLRP